MENKYKDKFYKLNKLYEQIKDTKKRLDSAVDEILLGNKQKEIVEKVSKKEQDEIIGHFSIDLKHPFNFTRTIDKSQIEHTLKKHGDNVTEEQRGNIAVSKDDIKNYLDIVHSADIKKYGYNDSNKPVVVSGKQVNGYFVVVEEVRTGKSDLAFFTMRKTKGQLQESALMLAKDKLPARRPKSLLSHSESITNSTIKNQEEKALEDISYEEALKKGLIPFANGHTLGAGFFGGSEALYNQRDYNNDGKVDEQDIAIGVIGGVIGFKALAKMFPSWFKETNVPNTINSNRLNKEKKNISKVAFGEKPSTIIRTYDENEIINLTKGYHNNAKDKGFGVQHIIVRHMQDDSTGKVSLSELTKIGEVIRDGELSINSNKRVYTLYKDDIRFRAITGENKDTQRVITFYSDRINSTGLGHSAQDYNSATSTTDGIIITYEPKTTFKEWLLDLKNQSKEIKEQNKESIKDFSLKEHGAKRNFGLSEQSTRNSSTNNSSGDTKIGAFVGSKPNEKRTIREQSKKELQEFKEHIKELSQRVHSTRKGLANKEEIKHLGKISLDGIKTLAKNSKEVAKKLNTGVNRNIVTKEALKQNNQNIKRSERRYKNR